MSRGWKITVIVLAVAGVLVTPVVWRLDGSDAGQFVGAVVQCAVGVAALAWAILAPQVPAGATDEARDTGKARATGGATARTGIRRPGGGRGGSAKAERTGDATADGAGSVANTGIDHS